MVGRAMQGGDPVTIRQVARARELMAQGRSMVQAAVEIGVRSSDLGRMLWAYIDTDIAAVLDQTPERPAPMF